MLRDVFYYGNKPNVHPRERYAENLEHARSMATTEHFWIINEFCDYKNFDWEFDFDFLADKDVWTSEHNNVWPSVHQKDSGTWLCYADIPSDIIIYRNDVPPLIRKKEISSNWILIDKVDPNKFDFSWHPDPTDPPYIYRWGCKFFPVEFKTVLEYHVPGATQIKYMKNVVELLPEWDKWEIINPIDKESFDFTWRPDPRDPLYIYEFATQHQNNGGPRYIAEGATEVKYTSVQKAKALPNKEKWTIPNNIDISEFDWSWHPDVTDPPYIYKFPTQWAISGGPIYTEPGATEIKYVDKLKAVALPNTDNWVIPDGIDVKSFDFSWHPYMEEDPYVYQFGTQHQKTGGPRYITPGSNEKSSVKYIDTIVLKATRLVNKDNFTILNDYKIKSFDWSWHPDDTEEPYIYVFGNTQYPGEIMPTIEYRMNGAAQVKYVSTIVAELDQDLTNWVIPDDVDTTGFDFSWKPNPTDPPYIYEFGTQWQKTGGPRYITPGGWESIEVKYVDLMPVCKLSNKDNFTILNDYKIKSFDWSWHPDDTEEPYIYVFGNTQYPGEIMPTIEYRVPGATQVKYVSTIVAELDQDLTNWVIPDDVDTTGFDFSWKPNPTDPPYIYEFGTQWQKTGGLKYITSGVDKTGPVKFIESMSMKVKKLPSKEKWIIPSNIDLSTFDFSWHPDTYSPAYNYQFPTQWALTGGPLYIMENAEDTKYIDTMSVRALPDKTNWDIPDDIDVESFDFSWHPYTEEAPYIYQIGTQHQKTGGPRYIAPGAWGGINVKYVGTHIIKANKLPNRDKFIILNDYKIKSFDWSWHPDDTEEPYIYVFGNTQYPGQIMPTIEYRVPGATQVKYVSTIVAELDQDLTNWEIPDDVDMTDFDFSWKPNPTDPPYIYEFGTQWQKTGGPRYNNAKGIDTPEIKYVDEMRVKKLSSTENWTIPENVDVTDFDFSWHPDTTEPAYIYQFATQWAMSGGPIYTVPNATEVKYLDILQAKALPDITNWVLPDDIDIESFDFSWHPYAEEDPYIYQFGTQHQKTGGPRYITPGTDENSLVKYIDTRVLKVVRTKEEKDKFIILNDYKIKSFDYTWHPDDTEEPYIYVFGNTRYPGEIMPTIEYRVSGATQVKYIHSVVAELDQDLTNWVIPDDVDTTGFDFSWKPNPNDPPYIYQFGTQHQKTGGPRYVTPGGWKSIEVKYVDTMKGFSVPNKDNFTILNDYKIKSFDWSWHPDDTEEPYIYVFGNTQYPGEIMPTIEYRMNGATQVKYISNIVAVLDQDLTNWEIPDDVDTTDFDFSWKPNPNDPPYVYQFGTQHQKTGGPRYVTPGGWKSVEVKYIDNTSLKAIKVKEQKEKFTILSNYKIKFFDYTWHPDDTEEPYIYVFGNTQYPGEIMPTIEYRVEGATQVKYISELLAELDHDLTNWVIPDNLNVSEFDFSWKPNPTDPPYVYEFGTQWQKTGGPRYITPGGWKSIEVKYVSGSKARSLPNTSNWVIPENINLAEFDFSWHPDATESAYIYQFGTQHQKTGGPRYVTPGSVKGAEIKYIDDIKARRLMSKDNWITPPNINIDNFDFSWHPDDTAPPYIYQFGTIEDYLDGPKYVTPNNNGEEVRLKRIEINESVKLDYQKYYIKTTLEDLVNEHLDEIFWALNPDIDYSEFDFTWRPSIEQIQYVHAFGSKNNINTQTYFVNGHQWVMGNRSINYVEAVEIDIKVNIDMFFVDKGNPESQSRFEALKSIFDTKIQKTRYLNSWVDTINRCINRSTTTLCWILNSELDYSNFDFNYYPDPWQMKMVHIFGTQWSHWGTTFLVNRETFPADTKYIKIIEHLSNLNFVNDRKAVATNNLYDMILIDHGNNELPEVEALLRYKAQDKSLTIVPYQDSYLETLRSILSKIHSKKEHYVWICSSICDYREFNFSYICDPFARSDLHVFPSQQQKFGDTFLLDVNKALDLINDLTTLQEYNKVNYNQNMRAKRLPAPVITVKDDTHVNIISEEFDFPYAVFVTEDNKEVRVVDAEPMCLWTPEDKNIMVTTTGATRIIAPKEIKQHVKNELYDYPYIKTSSKLGESNPLDIVFLSNGESGADENYEHLIKVTKGLANRVIRVGNVNGRVAAYHAALNASETPWAFTVFAKLRVNHKFDWGWQPDRLQIPKHYMFHAKNPVNGLEYGHQGIIAYNKKLVLANQGKGLDFTLDDPHETVPILSGIANYNTDPFSTWRTAFREAIKLKSDYSDISESRLEVWLNEANGDFAEWSLKGANDAVDYYKSVSGDVERLKYSYEWSWLKAYFNDRYNI